VVAGLAALVVVGVVLVVVVRVTSSGSDDSETSRPRGPTRVLLVGDSITYEYGPLARAELRRRGYDVSIKAIVASSILDAGQCGGAYARSLARTLRPDIVIQENIGNYRFYPPCSPDVRRGSPEFYGQWKHEAERVTRIFEKRGAKVQWILNPAVNYADGGVVPGINDVYRGLGVPTIDAWTAFGGGTFNPAMHVDDTHLSTMGKEVLAQLVVDAVTESGVDRNAAR
jgi:hypothetical protein